MSSGADLKVEDEDEDTALHLALMRQSVTSEQENTSMLDSVSVTKMISFFDSAQKDYFIEGIF